MTSGPIGDFLAFLRDTEQRYHMADADEQEAAAETQDILHCLELQEHDYREYAKLAKDLKAIRQKRRKAKDTMAECLPILNWLDDNRTVVKSLERLLGEVRKAEKYTEGPRVYTPRTKPKTGGKHGTKDD